MRNESPCSCKYFVPSFPLEIINFMQLFLQMLRDKILNAKQIKIKISEITEILIAYEYRRLGACWCPNIYRHDNDVIIGAMASQITRLPTIYSTVYSGTDQGKHQSSTSLAFVRGIHRSQVNSPHKGPVTRKIFPYDDVIMDAGTVTHWGTLLYNFRPMFIYWSTNVIQNDRCIPSLGVNQSSELILW